MARGLTRTKVLYLGMLLMMAVMPLLTLAAKKQKKQDKKEEEKPEGEEQEQKGVKYDNSAFYLLVLALMSLYLLPATIYYVAQECCAEEGYSASRMDTKARRRLNSQSTARFKNWSFFFFVVVWVAYIYLIMLDGVVEVEAPKFDPYSILGIEEGADDKAIKKAYRKLSLIWHPDKNPDNPEAKEKFIQISKANDALTDEDAKKNYEEFGNVDGRQAMTGSIGLPEFFMDEAYWKIILLVYFGCMIFGLPIVVYRWWSNTEQYTGTYKVFVQTMHNYYNKLNETTRMKQLPLILACSFEFSEIPIAPKDQPDMEDILACSAMSDLKARVRMKTFLAPFQGDGVAPGDKTRMEYVVNKKGYFMKALVLLEAWCKRLDPPGSIQDKCGKDEFAYGWLPSETLMQNTFQIVKDAPRLLQAMIEYCVQRRWLQPVIAAIQYSQCIVQQLDPEEMAYTNSAKGGDLMQLPHFSAENIKHCKGGKAKNKVLNTKQFMTRTPEERRSILRNFSDAEMTDVEECIAKMPFFDIEHSAYVKGDDEDVANVLYETFHARERELFPERFPKEEEANEDDMELIDDDEDEGERFLPRTEIQAILQSAECQELGFTPAKVRTALKELDDKEQLAAGGGGNEPLAKAGAADAKSGKPDVEYSNFTKILAKQVLKIHAMDVVTVCLDKKMIKGFHHEGELDVHCPNYPARKKCAWFAILGDPGRNQLINYIRIGDINKAKPEEMQIMFQPDKATVGGKPLELEVHLKCDSYGGLDVRFPLRLDILKQKEVAEAPPDGYYGQEAYSETDSDSESSSSSSSSEEEDEDEDDKKNN